MLSLDLLLILLRLKDNVMVVLVMTHKMVFILLIRVILLRIFLLTLILGLFKISLY